MAGKSGFRWRDLLTPEGGPEPVCAGWAGGFKAVLWVGLAVLAGLGLGRL